MYCARFNFGNNFKKYIHLLSHSFLNFITSTNPLNLRFMTGSRDNGGHLMEMHVFWYDGCNCGVNCGSTRPVLKGLAQAKIITNR